MLHLGDHGMQSKRLRESHWHAAVQHFCRGLEWAFKNSSWALDRRNRCHKKREDAMRIIFTKSSYGTVGIQAWGSVLSCRFRVRDSHSIARVHEKFGCQNSYLFQRYLKNFIGHDIQSCWLLFSQTRLICHIIWFYLVLGCILNSWFHFLGRKYLFPIWAAIFSPRAHIWVLCSDSKDGKQKNHCLCFACHWLLLATPIAIACHHCGPSWSE